ASCTLNELRSQAGARAHLVLIVAGTGDPDKFLRVPGVIDLTVSDNARDGATELRILTDDMDRLAPLLSQFAVDNEWRLLEMRAERPSLEDLFVQITEDMEIRV